MDHQILKDKIRGKIKCPNTLRLIDLILDSSPPQERVDLWFPGDDLLTPAERRHGLPIGNLTSQLWANVYLSSVDHCMTEHFGGRSYVRYVDDIALFSDDELLLKDALGLLGEQLESVRLRLHPAKTQILETAGGVNFLGFRIFPDRIRVRQENLRRARKRLRKMQWEYRTGRKDFLDVMQSVRSWISHLDHGDTWRLREKIFGSLVFQGTGEGVGTSGDSWRQLEQQREELSLCEPQQQQPGQPQQQHRVAVGASSCRPEFQGGNLESAHRRSPDPLLHWCQSANANTKQPGRSW